MERYRVAKWMRHCSRGLPRIGRRRKQRNFGLTRRRHYRFGFIPNIWTWGANIPGTQCNSACIPKVSIGSISAMHMRRIVTLTTCFSSYLNRSKRMGWNLKSWPLIGSRGNLQHIRIYFIGYIYIAQSGERPKYVRHSNQLKS